MTWPRRISIAFLALLAAAILPFVGAQVGAAASRSGCPGQSNGSAPAAAQERAMPWGSGSLGTPRSIFQAWMHSQGHRENILGRYGDTGIGLRTGALEGYDGAHVWTEEFGSREC